MKPKTTDPVSKDDLAAIVAAAGPHKHAWLRYVLLLLLAGGGIGGWFWWSQRANAQGDGPAFATEPVKRGDISLTITATGNLEPTNEVTVGSELSGIVLEVYHDINDRVT